MSFADELTVLAEKIRVQLGGLPYARARPVALSGLGWQLIHMGRQLVNEAAKRRGVPPPGRSQAEQDADLLSWDATRDPDLTGRGIQ